MHPSLTIYTDSVKQIINTGFEIETLANDCRFTEGPVWNKEGFYLFSDITANCIYKIVPGQPKEVYIANSGTQHPDDPLLKPDMTGSNALAYDRNGNLLVCQHGSHGIGKVENGVIQKYISEYEGRPFNSPNDLIVHSSGKVFFSDPPYGLKDGQLNPEKFQPLAGVYCYDHGDIQLVCKEYQYPNGVCISPDDKSLYICSNKPFENFISEYDVETLQFKRIVAKENSDGIKTDAKGNLYLGNKDGVLILNNRGERLALIQFDTVPANLCWGGEGLKDLIVCARQNVYLVRGLRK